MIEVARIPNAPVDLTRIVVAIDPPASVGPDADECGLIVAAVKGEGEEAQAYILADLSAQGLSPLEWAERAAAAFHQYKADRIIVEANQGGAMAETVLRQAGRNLPITRVHATRSKQARAEPVAALYERGRVSHVAVSPPLEDQMVSFTGNKSASSPDRLDALVWALTELMLGDAPATPRIRSL